MQDRVPLYPGRVKMTPVSGQSNIYDMERADQPQQVGTPLGKDTLLTDATAALIGSRQGLTDPDTPNEALALLGNRNLWGHANLLDNWDFRNPVDTKGGYVVPPGTAYYAGSGSYIGVTSSYYTVTSFSPHDNAFFKIDGTEYYTASGDYVRGYTGVWTETIDRWYISESARSVVLGGGITITGNGDAVQNYIFTRLSFMKQAKYTLSIVYKNNTGLVGLSSHYTDIFPGTAPFTSDANGMLSFTFDTDADYDSGLAFVRIHSSGSATIAAVKLELGDHQTLAHKDASGNWVLNDAGNYLEELAKAKAESGARVQTGSYVGTGTYGASNPNSLTFDFVPKLFYLQAGTTFGGYGQYGYEGMGDPKAAAVLWIPGVTTKSYGFAGSSWSSSTCATISFSGNTLSWYGTDNYTQANHGGTTYYWVAIG